MSKKTPYIFTYRPPLNYFMSTMTWIVKVLEALKFDDQKVWLLRVPRRRDVLFPRPLLITTPWLVWDPPVM